MLTEQERKVHYPFTIDKALEITSKNWSKNNKAKELAKKSEVIEPEIETEVINHGENIPFLQ